MIHILTYYSHSDIRFTLTYYSHWLIIHIDILFTLLIIHIDILFTDSHSCILFTFWHMIYILTYNSHSDIWFTLTYDSQWHIIHILEYDSHSAYVSHSDTWFTFWNIIRILTYDSHLHIIHIDKWLILTHD